jgi:hypothetical protein
MYRAGLLNEGASGVRLLPVRVCEEKERKPSGLQAQPGRRESSSIEVRLAKAQVRIVGAMDAGMVRAVLESLLR